MATKKYLQNGLAQRRIFANCIALPIPANLITTNNGHPPKRERYEPYYKMPFLLLFALTSLSATAEKWTNGNLLIKNIIWRPGYHGFYVDPATYHGLENCSTGPKQYLYVFDAATEADTKTMDRLFTLMTTAMVSNKRIHAFVNGCRGEFPVVTGLQLNN